jgi:hypothetical protein
MRKMKIKYLNLLLAFFMCICIATSVLTKAEITCVPILRGTAEYDSFVDIWVSHIKGPLSHFD